MFAIFSRRFSLAGCVAASLVLGGLCFSPADVLARKSHQNVAIDTEQGTVRLDDLPSQGREVHQLILQGGPFKFEKDGVIFGNRERQLPSNRRGYYREYTVKTPGSRDRGARRIVCGGEAKAPDACYYSDDHYASFRKIVP